MGKAIRGDDEEALLGRKFLAREDCVTIRAKDDDDVADTRLSYIIIIGCMYIESLVTFLPSSFGIFFSERLTSHSVSTGSISFIISTHMLLYDIGALMGPAVGQRLGYRRIIMTFLIIVTISFAILAFADSISGILVAYGVLLAISGGMLHNICALVVPIYFKKNRRRALAILSIGMSTGIFITAYLIPKLRQHYGYFGAYLVYGALFLQGCIPITLITSKQSGMELSASTKSVQEWNTANITDAMNDWWIIVRKNFTNYRIVTISLVRGIFRAGEFNFFNFLPFALVSMGYSATDSAWYIFISGLANTSGRIFVSVCIDSRWCCRKSIFAGSLFLTSSALFGFVFSLNDEILMTASMAVVGFGSGVYMSLYFANLVDIVGLEHYPDSLSVNAFMLLALEGPSALLLGHIRDWSGSYTVVLGACAAAVLGSGLMLAIFLARLDPWTKPGRQT